MAQWTWLPALATGVVLAAGTLPAFALGTPGAGAGAYQTFGASDGEPTGGISVEVIGGYHAGTVDQPPVGLPTDPDVCVHGFYNQTVHEDGCGTGSFIMDPGATVARLEATIPTNVWTTSTSPDTPSTVTVDLNAVADGAPSGGAYPGIPSGCAQWSSMALIAHGALVSGSVTTSTAVFSHFVGSMMQQSGAWTPGFC